MKKSLRCIVKVMLCSFLIVSYFFVQTHAEEPVILEDDGSFLFDDVQDPGKLFYEPVYWTVEKQITTGKSDKLFAPYDTCTRAQFVTFLWRMKGCPEPSAMDNPFTDVESGRSFSQAVLWAYENDVTTGTSDTTFSPFKEVTRGQVAAFLWRAFDKPIPEASNPFEDVPEGRSFTIPVTWMVENNITTGKSPTVFAPYEYCTRGQTVTFLYRLDAYLSSLGKTEYYDNGDCIYTPTENDILYDEEENDLYFSNLLVVYTFDEFTDEEADALAALVDGEVVGKITGRVNALQIKTDEDTLNGLEAQAEILMNDERVMYARADYPIHIPEETADNNPWSNGQAENDRGNENNPNGNDWWAEAIGAYTAWDYSSQTEPAKIGILDSGFQLSHPDLAGHIQLLGGYTKNTVSDHGTHVAGIIGAKKQYDRYKRNCRSSFIILCRLGYKGCRLF